MSTTLRLSDILGRGVTVDWFEAVALVREVADRVLDSVAGRGVPELDQIQLDIEGTLSITGATKTDEPVRRMGQLLQACLVQAEPPVQLRLAVAQATAPEPGYASIREYSEALAYFERPDRPAVLRGLHAKAQAVSAAVDTAPPTLDAIAPLETRDTTKRRNSTAKAKRPASRGGVIVAAAVVLLVVSVTAYSQFGPVTPMRAEVSTLALKASDAMGTTLVKGISAVTDIVGLGRLAPAGSSLPPATAPPVPPPAQARAAIQARKSSTPPATSTPFRLFDLEIPPVEPGIPAAIAPADAVVVITASPPSSIVSDLGNETVYSPDDSTVSPPVGVRPQLPRVLPGDVSPDRLSEIELVVLPDGTVGSVKLIAGRNGVLAGMLLSAAKAWKFKPAEKDGRPVAYRKTVWLVRE